MNATARLLCVLCCATTLSASEPLVNAGQLVRIPTENGPIDPNRYWVSGVVFMTGTPVALLTDTTRSRSRFIWGDAPVNGYQIREITLEQVILVERGSGKELRLTVGAKPESTNAKASDPAPFTKEWIESRANPMYGHPVSPPDGLYDDWPTATEADKAEIPKFYEKYGWKLVRAEVVAGAVDFVWEWVYEAERVAAAQASYEAFARLLSPEQSRLWAQIQANPLISPVDGKFTEEQQKFITERSRISAEFRATFTPEQKAAFDEMSRQRRSGPKPPDGKEPKFTLPLLASTDPAPGGGPAPYTKAWINSKANPMLQKCDFASEFTNRWATLSKADRIQIVEYYQKHGWQLRYLETVSGFTGSLSWGNIYEKERIAVQQAQREAFLNLLSPEQLQAWKTGPTSQTIFTKDGNPDYARNRNGPQQQRFFDPFWASLDARQRAAYEGMNDFTLADWN